MVFGKSRMFPLSESDLNVIPSLEVPTTRHPFPLISEIRTMRISNRFEKHIVAAATVAMSAAAANAAIVTWNANLIIPNNIDGLYINVETGVSGSAAGLVNGWDINPYGTSTTTMSWFAAAAPSGCVTGFGTGGTITGVANLSNGTLVSAASTFGNTASGVANGGWVLNAANYFGFRFVAADALTHYGYGVMTVGATMGVRTLTSVFYESVAATGITVVAVPAPGALALLGLAGFASRRRRS
jgi:MYXO-CTERM domain-containing protein